MKIRVSLTLFLTAVLTLSAFAQEPTSSTTSTQATTPRETATGEPPLPVPYKAENWWDGSDPGLAWLVLHPFASKKYVRRNAQVIQDRINELDRLTATNSSSIKDLDGRVQQGLQLASTRTKLADDHATEATNKAQQAYQSATALNTHLTNSEAKVSNLDQFKATGQTEIRFRPGQTVLSKQAKDALDEMAGKVKDQHGYIFEVQGFSSGRGQAAIANSRKLADAVVRYLMLSHDIPSYRIFVLGMGNTPVDNRAGTTRVQVSLLKNEVEVAKQ